MRNIIVIGASAGGINAIKKLLSGLDATIDAAICVVQHIAEASDSEVIAAILQKQTGLVCSVARHEQGLEPGHVYIAPTEHHLLIAGGLQHLTNGPHENKYRPSIDVLFRSAAVDFGHRVIAVVLTGMLEDGTSGMVAVKRCGGVCIVQNPLDAEFSSMPESVLNTIHADYTADLSDIPKIIAAILKEPLPPAVPVPDEIKTEAEITMRMMSDIDQLKNIADRSDFVCPDCGGALWQVRNDPSNRYRCYTGHVYTEKLLDKIQNEKIEESVWVSIRMFEEKVNLLKVMLLRQADNDGFRKSYSRRIADNEAHINRLKMLLNGLSDSHKDQKQTK